MRVNWWLWCASAEFRRRSRASAKGWQTRRERERERLREASTDPVTGLWREPSLIDQIAADGKGKL